LDKAPLDAPSWRIHMKTGTGISDSGIKINIEKG
jgi:hypothetical protein